MVLNETLDQVQILGLDENLDQILGLDKTLDQILGLDMELDNEFLDFGPGVGWDIHQTPDLPCISHART